MIKYLDGNKEADQIIDMINEEYAGVAPTLTVYGEGPFRRQIERMADKTGIELVTHMASTEQRQCDVDVVNPYNISDFFTGESPLQRPPCVVQAVCELIKKYCDLSQGVTVLGRGRFGAFVATVCARSYGRVVWQSASDPIERPGIIVNCSRQTPASYPDGSTVIDINKLGRLTTAVLLLRTAKVGHGAVKFV